MTLIQVFDMWTIFEKEFKSYFITPTGYVFIFVFMLSSGINFGIGNIMSRSCDMLSMLSYMSYIWSILCPFLIMRLIAGELQRNTDKLLFSTPCSITSIITGKFFAAFSVMMISVLLTGINMIIMAKIGTLYLTETLAGYIGFILLASMFIALDLFVSCVCRNQFTAAVFCIGINIFLWLSDLVSSAIGNAVLDRILSFLSPYKRFELFSLGIISFSDTVFFIAFTVLFLFLGIRVLDARRWRKSL